VPWVLLRAREARHDWLQQLRLMNDREHVQHCANHHHILFPSQYENNRYSAITCRIIEMVCCQKSKCRPLPHLHALLIFKTFIPAFTQTHSIIPTIQTSKRPK